MNIYCAISLDIEAQSFLREQLEEDTVVFQDKLEVSEQRPAFLQAKVCFGNAPPGWLEQTERLEWIQLESVGFGEYQNVDPKTDFVMTHLKGFFDVPVAESALAGILALYRKVDTLTRLQQRKEWVGQDLRPHMKTLKGAKVCVLGGSGGIGSHLIRLLEPFETELTVFGRRPSKSDITTPSELERILPETDVLISSLPETNETIQLMNEKRLRLLAPHAIFVNVGRGSLVDEPALINLLQEEKIGGAVLDVTEQEPLPPEHPLWTCPNTLLTQHTGGGFDREVHGKVEVFLDNLRRFREGETPKHVVNLERGY